mmetsp:Transcript_61248/g.138623  ORF Transcript_61248/g.138623 Transcript_61248/m.138623 type:complete len:120 (+) Transcript_61248:230-589(+)
MLRSIKTLKSVVGRSAPQRKFGAPLSEAHLFGIKPGTYQNEGWEPIVYTTYVASFFVLSIGLYFRPTSDLKTWAIDEAKARKAIKDNGGEVEWGVHYGGTAKFHFSQEEVGEIPRASDE